jgi:hypothetical protein
MYLPSMTMGSVVTQKPSIFTLLQPSYGSFVKPKHVTIFKIIRFVFGGHIYSFLEYQRCDTIIYSVTTPRFKVISDSDRTSLQNMAINYALRIDLFH